jgi:hypothetical protein
MDQRDYMFFILPYQNFEPSSATDDGIAVSLLRAVTHVQTGLCDILLSGPAIVILNLSFLLPCVYSTATLGINLKTWSIWKYDEVKRGSTPDLYTLHNLRFLFRWEFLNELFHTLRTRTVVLGPFC